MALTTIEKDYIRTICIEKAKHLGRLDEARLKQNLIDFSSKTDEEARVEISSYKQDLINSKTEQKNRYDRLSTSLQNEITELQA